LMRALAASVVQRVFVERSRLCGEFRDKSLRYKEENVDR
jgi:hypothetical protein